jgi:hypothetical protein
MNVEIWKAIPEFEGLYEVSSLGRIRSLDRIVEKRDRHTGAVMKQLYRGKILKQNERGDCGHLYVHIGVCGKKKKISVHRAVLLAFVGEAPEGFEACHNNGDAKDNRISNLRWDTHLNNNRDRKAHGHYSDNEQHPMCVYSNDVIKELRASDMSHKDAKRLFGISTTHFYRVKSNRNSRVGV